MSYSLKSSSGLSKPLVILLSTIGIVLILGAALFGAQRYYQQQLEPVTTSEDVRLFEISAGDSAQTVANKLEEAGLIRAAWAFSWHLRSEGLRGDIRAGTYAISPSQPVSEIAAIITGQTESDTLTITILPERRIDQIQVALINEGFSPEEVEAAFDPALYQDHPALADKPATASLEGYLYPETFRIEETTTVQEIIEWSLDEMATRLTPDIREGIKGQGLTVHEGIILASIVEREVSNKNPDDRPQVAQVFYSRLAEGVRLESNATARYGAVLAGLDPNEHPTYNSEYNTYRNDGLPPSPISNVSESSLQAVAQPADTNYLYFVSADGCLPDIDEPCVNYFSTTLQQHEQNVQQYCPIRCSQPH